MKKGRRKWKIYYCCCREGIQMAGVCALCLINNFIFDQVICPTAPNLPVTINGGMEMPAW